LKTKQKQQKYDFEKRNLVQYCDHRGTMTFQRGTMGDQAKRVCHWILRGTITYERGTIIFPEHMIVARCVSSWHVGSSFKIFDRYKTTIVAR
jgi:hypothetical protein